MKKKGLFVSILILVVVLSFVCTACNSTNKITKYYEKLDKTNNVTICIQMQIPVLGDFEVVMKTDENKSYASEFFGEPASIHETIDDTIYTYTKNGDEWQKDNGKPISDTEEEDDDDFSSLFDADNYEYSKKDKAYVAKDNANISFSGMNYSKLTMTIDGDECTIKASMLIEGMVTNVRITFSDIGKTKVDLPNVN